jgi:hypothetical protein
MVSWPPARSACGPPEAAGFTAEYKMRIVAEYDQLDDPGARGALLRREGLYTSNIFVTFSRRHVSRSTSMGHPAVPEPGTSRALPRRVQCGPASAPGNSDAVLPRFQAEF